MTSNLTPEDPEVTSALTLAFTAGLLIVNIQMLAQFRRPVVAPQVVDGRLIDAAQRCADALECIATALEAPETEPGLFAATSRATTTPTERASILDAKDDLALSACTITQTAYRIERTVGFAPAEGSSLLVELDAVLKAQGRPSNRVARQLANLFGKAVEELETSINAPSVAEPERVEEVGGSDLEGPKGIS
ncbi:MAG: hypothetical protein WAL64_01365 [Candidatus Dormiibacterota bacterium]